MSAVVCNTFDVMLRTPGERHSATVKIIRIVFTLVPRIIVERVINIGNFFPVIIFERTTLFFHIVIDHTPIGIV